MTTRRLVEGAVFLAVWAGWSLAFLLIGWR